MGKRDLVDANDKDNTQTRPNCAHVDCSMITTSVEAALPTNGATSRRTVDDFEIDGTDDKY